MISLKLSLSQQRLVLFEDDRPLRSYPVSTALNGPGEREGSGCTPRGRHYIRARIGEGLPPNAVFVGRRFTGEIYNAALAAAHPGRDWILTRILWLCGLEPGRNRLGQVDTMRRYIYIHGTPDTEPMGIPLSHGCVRMRNTDLLDLFGLTPVGTELQIDD
ncbi:L,D-transpeptidase [Marinobacterium nitratireducens]|uniref:L,D-transpeptidase n=1 Tax=Marinobacterium nitratireducens TaxID=518897 RepID=A0A918DQZ2_9GAMM|nr:L,D-transpeptidase [Marinobacterium nitratireducens]GGO80562.1 L,D-transpeptidase [Marinobacterium nitratireducens]